MSEIYVGIHEFAANSKRYLQISHYVVISAVLYIAPIATSNNQ